MSSWLVDLLYTQEMGPLTCALGHVGYVMVTKSVAIMRLTRQPITGKL
jgi:hypothetical protein